MRGSVLSRARNGGLMSNDGGLTEEQKKQWVTAKLRREDVRLMREMCRAGWSTRYVGRIFGIGRNSAYAICTGQRYPNV